MGSEHGATHFSAFRQQSLALGHHLETRSLLMTFSVPSIGVNSVLCPDSVEHCGPLCTTKNRALACTGVLVKQLDLISSHRLFSSQRPHDNFLVRKYLAGDATGGIQRIAHPGFS